MQKTKWFKGTLQDFGEIFSGGTPKTKIPEYWGEDVSWITPADLSGYSEKYIHKGRKSITHLGLEKSSAKLIPKGSVLFSSRAPIGYVAIAGNDLCTNQGFKSLVPSEAVNSDFLYYYLKSIKQLAENRASGTTFKELSGKAFGELPLSVPPLPEQRAIVSKIELLFSELDNGIANLKLAQEQLKVYRQAVLKKAFEGELTKEWREQQVDLPGADELLVEIKREREEDVKASGKKLKSLKPLSETEISALPMLPEEWRWVKLGELTDMVSGRAFKKSEYSKEGVRLFQIANVSFGFTIWDTIINLPGKYLQKYPELVLKEGDLLIALNRPLIQRKLKICRLSKSDIPAILYQRVGRLDFFSEGYEKYMLHFMQGPSFISAFEKELQGIDIPFINKGKLLDKRVPICSKEEMTAIVTEIETRLSVCDKLEQDIAENLEKAEVLRQSILKKAFEGKLLDERELEEVRNAPDWEPAEKLLEKISAKKKSKK